MVTQASGGGPETRNTLLDAVERLCEVKSPAEVTMREVAEQAGVSVGLAYHHFGSKQELFAATMDRMAASYAQTTVEQANAADYEEATHALFEIMRQRPAFVRMIAWMILSNESPTRAMGGHPLLRRISERTRASGHPDPGTTSSLLALFALSAAFFGPIINTASGREATDGRVQDALARIFADEANRAGPAA